MARSISSSPTSRCVTARRTPGRIVGLRRTPASASLTTASADVSPSAPASSCTKFVSTESGSTGTPRSAQPSARRRARAWSSARRSTLCSSAYRPAAATMPAWRIAPPKRCFSTRARRHQLADCRRSRPQRAAEALGEAQRDRVRHGPHPRRGDAGRHRGVREPSAVEVNREAELGGAVWTTAPSSSSGQTVPPGAVVGVLDRDERGARDVDPSDACAAASICAGESRPRWPGRPRVWRPECIAAPPSSAIMMCAVSSTIS